MYTEVHYSTLPRRAVVPRNSDGDVEKVTNF